MKAKLLRSLILGLAIMGASAGVHAATVTWDGGGGDGNFSTAANWDSDSVPTSSDAVVFDSTSSKNCTIDQNVEVTSFTIASTYSGVVSGGSYAITVNTGNFDPGDTTTKFSAGTGTIKFTGSANQQLKFPSTMTYYDVENRNTGGALTIGNLNVTLHKLTVIAGTTTKLSINVVTVTDIDLQGSAGNVAYLRSTSTVGTVANFRVSGSQTVAYVDFKDINATGGDTLDGGTGCVDSGNNTNINFNGIKWWVGSGADTNWSTAANWSGSGVPAANQHVFFDGTSTKNCTIDGNVEVAGVTIKSGYTGVVSAGSNTITVNTGDFDPGSTTTAFSAGTSTIKFTGTANQRLKFASYMTYYDVENRNTGGALTIGSLNVTLHKLTVIGGTTTKLSINVVTVTDIDLQGSAGNLAHLCSTISGTVTNFQVSGSQTIAYADFKDVNANGGSTLDARSGGTDSGNNTNIRFTKYWDGGGADEYWATAANWQGDVAPGTLDDVVFNATSSKACTIGSNVEVSAFTIASTYTGVVSAGASTITINNGNFDPGDTTAKFSAGTSTIKFTGSANQQLTFPNTMTYYSIENRNTGGALTIGNLNVTLHKLTVIAGTTTKLSINVVTVTDIDLQGASGNVAYLRSTSAVGQAANFRMSGSQTVAYVDFKDIDAGGGDTIDGGNNCVDSGNNVNINFNGIKWWVGSGADTNWSTSANWSGSSVPTSSQHVFFTDASTKHCTIDGNVEIAGLKVKSGYTGTISAGANTVTVNAGDFDCSPSTSAFDAGTGTVKFTGSGVQRLCYQAYETFNKVENAKSGSYLEFYYANVTVGELKAGAGTTTKLSNHTSTIASLDLQGSTGNPATLCNRMPAAACGVKLTGTQTVSYTAFQNINASLGYAIDASDNCTDSGNNTYVFFNVRRWDDGGGDSYWSTAANWSGNTLPTSSDIVVFDGAASGNCVMDGNAEVAGVFVDPVFGGTDYTGQIQAGSYTLTVNGTYCRLGTTANFDAGTGILKLTGTGALDFEYGDGETFGTLELDGSDVALAGGFTATTFKVTAGAMLALASGKTVTAATIDWQGTSSDPILLLPTAAPTAWELDFTNTSQTVSHVWVAHCDASAGTQIDGTDDCIDLGGNTNWLFDDEDGITLPSSSATSPLCVEGRLQGGGETPVTVSTNGTDYYNATMVDGALWYYDATLSATSAVTVTVKYNGAQVASQSVTWSSTDIGTAGSIDIRKDDSLLLTLSGTGTTLEIDADYDGQTFSADYTGAPGDKYAYQYSTAKAYTSAARIDGGTIQTMTVNALSASLGTARLGCWSGYAVPRTVSVTPSALLEKVWFGTSNDAYLGVTETSTAAKYSLVAYDIDTTKALVARVGDAFGAILAYKQADCFDLEWSTSTHLPVLKAYGDGDKLVGSCIRMVPYYGDVALRLDTRSASVLFETGNSKKDVPTDDFDQNGQYDFYMVFPEGAQSCHSVSVIEK